MTAAIKSLATKLMIGIILWTADFEQPMHHSLTQIASVFTSN